MFVSGKGPNAYAATFRGDGGSNFSQGQDDQLVPRRSHNEEVLSTLTKLTGANSASIKKRGVFLAPRKSSRGRVCRSRDENRKSARGSSVLSQSVPQGRRLLMHVAVAVTTKHNSGA